MLPLYLLACHMVGDFLFQSRWQSDRKRDSHKELALHVATYTLAFVPLIALRWPGGWDAALFLVWLAAFHLITDERRYVMTLGDVVEWALRREFREARYKARWSVTPKRLRLKPNPWPAMPLMIDQTLHVVQLAVLGGLFLS